jgi:biotin carboxylase
MKLKFLILGQGSSQLDALIYLRGRGCEVHVAANQKSNVGLDCIDYFVSLDILDKEALLEYCREYEIDSIGSDFALPSISFVSEFLGLPVLFSSTTAAEMTNKTAIRERLSLCGITHIPFVTVEKWNELADWKTFPAIIKPTDSQGQRGVAELYSIADVDHFFAYSKEYSRSGKVIVEEYMTGQEISVNAFLYKGELKYCFVSDRLVVEGYPGGIPRGHSMPAAMPDKWLNEVTRLVEASAREFGIQDGPLYFQMKYNDTDLKIIELTPRLDGCHLWRLIQAVYGIDLLDLTFRVLMGEEIDFKPAGTPVKHEIDFALREPGVPFHRNDYPLLANQLVYETFFYAENETIRPVNGRLEKVGLFLYSKDTE